MIKMRFHWENESVNKKGSFTVDASTVEDCMEIAKDELGVGYEMVDWYVV